MSLKSITSKTAVKVIRRKPMPKALEIGFRESGYENYLKKVYSRTAELLTDNRDTGKALMTHLEQILPCIAFYETLTEITGSKEKALEEFEKWAFLRIEKLSAMAKGIMKIPGLYKKVPDLADKMLDSYFGEAGGFKSRAVPGGKHFSRDMTVCPYYETCKRYGCPEITQFFCKSDDITYGNLHPKLVWGRTQTLGTGGECCDFKLYIND